MRIFSAILSATLATAIPACAYTVEDMWAEFDASKLTMDEKRFLQFGLALDGKYSALMDGAWGNGSQRALEAWARDVGLDPPIENWRWCYSQWKAQIVWKAMAGNSDTSSLWTFLLRSPPVG